MLVVCDIETNALRNSSRLWLIGCKEVDTGKVTIFREPDKNPSAFLAYASRVSGWIGHNFLQFDLPEINRLVPGASLDATKVIDTLIISRLLNFNLENGHSLDAWGQRLGFPKLKFNDFDNLTEEMVTYLEGDLEVTYRLFEKFKPYIFSDRWKKPLRAEHDLAIICRSMSDHGFAFDIDKAKSLHQQLTTRIAELDVELQTAFPPRPVSLGEILPEVTKHGTIHRGKFRWVEDGDLTSFSPGAAFTRISFEPFNPGSAKQRVEVLNAAGWRPTEKTKGHLECERNLSAARWKRLSQAEVRKLEERLEEYKVYGWKTSEENLSTLPRDAPEAAQKLVEWLLLASRTSVLNEWTSAYNDTTGSIHGSFNGIGAWTQRMSHAAPNMANIPRDDAPYGADMRSMWIAPKDRYLIGVDADSIQLRILAHYMDDAKFTTALVSGDKKQGTDAHSMNQKALGLNLCTTRDVAKTFIYAWLLGAGIAKIAEILNCTQAEARIASDNFLSFYPGLRRLKEEIIPRDAASGYFEGLDGRLVMCDNEHLMLAGYLQNGEKVAMTYANRIWRTQLDKERIPYWQVNFVHDEWQTYTIRDMDVAKYVAQVQADALRKAGEELGMKCPLLGSINGSHGQLAIGDNWLQTH
jgi:DNA polymerase-1